MAKHFNCNSLLGESPFCRPSAVSCSVEKHRLYHTAHVAIELHTVLAWHKLMHPHAIGLLSGREVLDWFIVPGGH